MKISKGKIKAPHLLLVFGIDGIGKTSFAADADSPIFIGAERGTNNIDTSRFDDIKTYDDVLMALDYLLKGKHEYKTAVIDSLDWLENMLYAHLLKKHKTDAIENIGGGFGRYINVIMAEWKIIIEKLNELREKKLMNIILVAHSQIKPFNDPLSMEPYDRYVLKLQDKTSAMFREYVDAVLFFNYETFVKKDRSMTKAKAVSDGNRYIFTTKTAAYDAKNRFELPERIDLVSGHPFKHYEMIVEQSSDPMAQAEKLKKDITELSSELSDESVLLKIKESVEKAKNDCKSLTAIRNRIAEIIESKGA